jgi:PAS domain S-box-containing protein
MSARDLTERVLILAPFKGDAAAIAALLSDQGFDGVVCDGAHEAGAQLGLGAGALILTDEALQRASTSELFGRLESQPTWSELPLIVLAAAGTVSRVEHVIAWLTKAAGSVTVLERPISMLTLVRSVQVALRSRRRQYQVRDLLQAQQERESELRESEERWRLALEGAELGSWDVDVQSGRALWNQRHYKLLGYEPPVGPATIDLWSERVHPEDRARVLQEIEYARQENRPIAVEHRVLGPEQQDLGWLALYGRFYYDDAGRAMRLSGVSRNITEEKRAAENARLALEAQARLAAMVNSSSDAIIGEDLTGMITAWNRGAERLYGYAASEVLGTPVLRLVPLDLHHEHAQALATIGRGQSVEAHETMRLRRDGSRIHVSLSVSPILDARGAVVGASKIARDITLLITARRMQQALTEQLQESDRRKNQFLATLSHELRNPLAPIRNAAHILASPKLSPEQLKWSREIISRQAQHMARLLEDLLDIARVTHGKLSLHRANVLLSAVVDAAVEAVQPLIGSRKHELVVRLPQQSVELDGDAVRLTQVFSNLLTNAAKYTEPGGHIELTALVEQSVAKVSVRDNGMGIAPDVLPNIFQMFTQSADAKAYAQGGLGIGLALTKGLVELHGGAIDARSQVGDGSVFTVTLPVSFGVSPLAREASFKAVTPLRLLIVDDNRDAADSLAALLRADGHTVTVAYSGEDALRRAALFGPEVGLLDLGMPEMDGYELAKRIRKESWGKSLKLLALTGWGQEEDRRRTSAATFDGHLVKPVDMEDIRAVLAQAIPAPRARSQVAPAHSTAK